MRHDSAPQDSRAARAALDVALRDLCRDFNAGIFTPILEADVGAYLYHRLLTNGCAPNTVHLQTRVSGDAVRTRKPDLVIGRLRLPEACVDPSLICELKVFQRWGHTDQQMRHRFSGVLNEDLASLAQFAPLLPGGTVEIVADLYVSAQRRGYLTGNWDGQRRIDVLAAECKRVGTSLIWIKAALDTNDVDCELVVP
jgi:hypothetical protein